MSKVFKSVMKGGEHLCLPDKDEQVWTDIQVFQSTA
jgi:hypothetical protein